MVNCERFVNTWFTSNTYILSLPQKKDIWVIDPGDVQPLLDWMKANGKNNITGVLLTHAHFDHIYGVNDIIRKYPNTLIFTANNYGCELLSDAKKNASQYTDLGPIVIDRDACIQYYQTQVYLWPNVSMTVYNTPGHSEDSVCLLIEDKLFTGDTLIKNIRTVTKLKGGSVEKLEKTIVILESLKDMHLTVFGGHEDPFLLKDYDLAKAIKNK